MATLFWDASALAKRYIFETGSDVVDALFSGVTRSEMLSTPWGYAETYSILLRRRNGGVLDAASFTTAVTALQDEIIDDEDFRLLSVDDAIVFESITMMHGHNLNATDAALLVLLVAYTSSPLNSACTLVTSDLRLFRAAQAEGLSAINPELLTVADVAGLLATLP